MFDGVGFAEYHIAQKFISCAGLLAQSDEQTTRQPTMKWIYRLFHGVSLIRVQIEQHPQEIVINLNPTLRKIIHYFGDHALKIYGMAPE